MARRTPTLRSPILFALGCLFAALGAATIVNFLIGWRIGFISWAALAYAALNLCIATGLFRRAHWVLTALASVLVGDVVIAILRTGVGYDTIFSLRSLIGIVAIAAIVALVYSRRASLRTSSPHDRAVGGIFLILWAIVFINYVLVLFT